MIKHFMPSNYEERTWDFWEKKLVSDFHFIENGRNERTKSHLRQKVQCVLSFQHLVNVATQRLWIIHATIVACLAWKSNWSFLSIPMNFTACHGNVWLLFLCSYWKLRRRKIFFWIWIRRRNTTQQDFEGVLTLIKLKIKMFPNVLYTHKRINFKQKKKNLCQLELHRVLVISVSQSVFSYKFW